MKTMTSASEMVRVLAVAVCALAAGLASAAERAIEKEVVIQATLDQAWDAWTTREGITSFFAPDARIDPKPGGAFEVYINPFAVAGLKGADDMRYLALQPKRMLSFTWNAPPSLPEVRQQRTVVIIRFTPVSDTQTRITLHHTGWGDGGEWDKAFGYLDKAWSNVLGNLQKRFAENKPVDWTEWLERMRKFSAEKK
jgi:uncharacterized protein YndB with AHSA1/START domain